jgi:serine/threonine protein kinase
MQPVPEDELERFLKDFWRDVDAGSVAAIEDYCARFPNLGEEVREEYSAWQAASHEAPGAGDETQPARDGLPDAIGRYRVIGQFARGGMGLLLLGRDVELARKVVIKTPRAWTGPLSQHQCDRLLREARLASRLAHDGICPVLDVITLGDRVFVVMPFIDGESLACWIERAAVARRVPAPASTVSDESSPRSPLFAWVARGVAQPAIEYLEKVARIVHAAHEAGIVHRDIKPSNLMVRADGEPVVLDFGLAIELDDDVERWTREGEFVGSPDYMAPEQIDGARGVIDRRTDVYALGVVLYEVLTLARPYAAPTPLALLDRVRRGVPVRPRTIDARIPRDLEAVCLKAMAAAPRDRYGTALELAEDLRCVRMLQATQAHPLSTTQSLLRRLRRNPRAAAAVVLGALLLAVAAVLLLQKRELEHRTQCASALLRIYAARAANSAPAPADVATLRDHVTDEASLRLLLQATEEPDAQAFLAAALRGLQDGFRSSGHELDSTRPLAPRASIDDCRPAFVIRLPESGRELPRKIVLRKSTGEIWSFALSADRAPDGSARFELPPGTILATGDYSWRIEREPDAGVGARTSSTSFFRVVAPELAADLRATCRPTGDHELDRILLGARLLAHELAADAAAELTPTTARLHPGLEHLRRVLLAMAARRLEDVEGLQALARSR